MTLRTKLFLFIPALVVLIHLVAFFLFRSGVTVQESYRLMTDRLLVYKQAAQGTEDSLRVLSAYLSDPGTARLAEVRQQQEQLAGLEKRLREQSAVPGAEHALEDYRHLLGTFLEQEAAVLEAVEGASLSVSIARYDIAEKTAGFVREEGQRLVDLELGYYQPYYAELLARTAEMNRLAAAIFVVDTLLSVVFALWLSRSITGPVGQLMQAARRITRGDLRAETALPEGRDELGILARAFRRMQKGLLEHIAKEKEHLEKDRLVKELELKALQSQIHPHFLFNTLNVLSKLALLEGAEKTSRLTVSVSDLLRYSLSRLDRPVTLREETAHARAYIAIQEARFRDRVRFLTEIDDAALDTPVPALTLQPLLENAFVHGLEGMEEGAELRLGIRREPGEVQVTVSDNGKGMSEEVRGALLRLEDEPLPASEGAEPSTGIGTRNVLKRLALLYGPRQQVSIDSQPGRGTTVTIRIVIDG